MIGSAASSAFFLLDDAKAFQFYTLKFKADGENVALNLKTSNTTSSYPQPGDPTGYTFTGREILEVTGTDGGSPVVGLLPRLTNLMPAVVNGATTFGSDNLLNYLGGSLPNQLSNGGYGGGIVYKVNEGGGIFKDYQFYYGLHPVSQTLGYQGCFRPSGVLNGCTPVIVSDVQVAPAPLPLLGAAAILGSVRRLHKVSSRLKNLKNYRSLVVSGLDN